MTTHLDRSQAAPKRRPTVEWQVCGHCNYDCSYCIQSRKYRVGHPDDAEVERFLGFFESLPGQWEVKMTGGEPFSFKAFMREIIPGLIHRTPHKVSVLTNLSASSEQLKEFARLTRGRLGIVSASLHLEFTELETFIEKATRFRDALCPNARMVINEVVVPGTLAQVTAARHAIQEAGLRFFPQLYKTKTGVFDYDDGDREKIVAMIGQVPTPTEANTAPSYRGRLCWTGVEYFVLMQNGDAWSCRTAKRFKQGYLGNALRGTVSLRTEPRPCAYDICPCTVPANRGMIAGVGLNAESDLVKTP